MKITENCFNGEQLLFVLAASLIVFNPYNKSGLSVVQGLYGEFAKIFAFVGVVLCSVSYYKLIGVALYEKLAIYTVYCLIAYALLWILFLVCMIYKYEKSEDSFNTLPGVNKRRCLLNHLSKALLVWEIVIVFSLHLCIWMTDVYSTKVGYDTRETCEAPKLDKPPVESCEIKVLR